MTALDRTALRALMGTLAAFAIGGCAATNVANTWQCPLVQGSVCARVAEVDPAAPKRVSMDTPAGCEPRQRNRPWFARGDTATGRGHEHPSPGRRPRRELESRNRHAEGTAVRRTDRTKPLRVGATPMR